MCISSTFIQEDKISERLSIFQSEQIINLTNFTEKSKLNLMKAFLQKAANVIASAQRKVKIAKGSNIATIKLSLINQVSNELCWAIDTANILYQSKLYIKHRQEVQQIINKVQKEFNTLNSDSQLYGQCLVLLHELDNECYLDLDDGNILEKIKTTLKTEKIKQGRLNEEDKDFLKMLVGDYEFRYFMGKSEETKDKLEKLKRMQGQILSTLLYNQDSDKKKVSITREELYGFQVPPDAYIGYMSNFSKINNQIELSLPSHACSFLLKNCQDPKIRENLFEGLLNTSSSNQKLMEELRLTRQQFSDYLGFYDYQHYQFALNSRFFSTSNQLQRDKLVVIQRILNSSVERCHKKLQTLFSDTEFYQSLVERANLDQKSQPMNSNPLMQAITIQQVDDSKGEDSIQQIKYSDLLYLRQKILGTPIYNLTIKWYQAFNLVNSIANRFFNLEFREIQQPDNNFLNRVSYMALPSKESQEELNWNEKERNIRCYEVWNNLNQQRIGIVFLDLNAYEDAKTCFSSGYCEVGNFKQLPILLVRLNFKAVQDDSDLTFDNCSTFMHEMGHVVHSLLNRHKYQLLSNNFKLDYAEICAKLFENLHFILPPSETPPLFQEKKFIQHIELFRIQSQLEQVYYAKLDLYLHQRPTPNAPALKDFSNTLQKNIFRQLLNVHDNSWFCNLSHLDEYSALYFSYAFGEELFFEIQELAEDDIKKFLHAIFTSGHQ